MSTSDARAGAELVEPARLRAVTLAADVVARLPADEVPAALRPIARFAAAKRARLGAAALAAALDADEAFRAKVAEVVAEATPQLVEAVRAGAPTGASDPLDVAVVAYLTRPDGWESAVAAANERWRAGAAPSDAAADEAARLRGELTELRARAKGEPARVKDAIEAATGASRADLAEARSRLRALTAQLRDAERARDEAIAAAEEARQRFDRHDTAREGELRRLRARVGELERAGEGARRTARADRDLDDARLWLLVDTLTEAAAGIRRELSLAPPSLRPGDSVAAGRSTPEAPARRTDDPALFDRLLALPDVHLVIDGYNVTKTGYPDLSLADQRSRLISSLVGVAARAGAEITVAFDGGARPPVQPPTPRGVRVLFSAADEIADDLIRRIVAAEPPGRPVVVVTSDQQVVTDVLAAGAWTAASSVLLAKLS